MNPEYDVEGLYAVKRGDIVDIKMFNYLYYNNIVFKLTYNTKEKEFTWVNDLEDNNNEKVTVKLLDNGLKITYSQTDLTVSIEGTNKSSQNAIDLNYKASIEFIEDNNKNKLAIECNNKTQIANSIKEFSTADAVDLNYITEAEAEALGNELMTNLSKSKIGQSIVENRKRQQEEMLTKIYCTSATDCVNNYDGTSTCKYRTYDENYNVVETPIVCPTY